MKVFHMSVFLVLMHLGQYIISSEQSSSVLRQARWLLTNAQSQFIERKILSDQFDTTIYEQSGIIASEKEKIKNEEIITKQTNITHTGYLASIRKALMAWSGYEVTEEQKKARQDLDVLIQQKEIVNDEYGLVDLDDDLISAQKDDLKTRYATVIARIDTEIYQKQAAIGDRWSLLKKAFVAGAVAAAGTVAGLVFMNNWWMAENK